MDDKIDSVEQLRLQVLANGYTPIRNRDKRTFMRGWPQAVVDEAEIKRWSRRFSRDKATGIRVEDGLAVIDIDVDDRELVDRIANRILDVCPTLEDENVPLLVRRGKGAKEAWFVRTDEAFSRIHSRAWVRPGEAVDGGSHRVEIFGGAVARQFGSFGPHTVDDDGSVAIRYAWASASPADTPKSELPVLTKAQFFAIVDVAEAELRSAGWNPVEKSQKGESDAVRVYDLTDEMQFDLNTGERVSLLELRELAANEGSDVSSSALRCSASFLEGPSAVNRTRCIVGVSRAGNLTIWESASGVTHSEASAKPRDYTVEIDRIAERLKERREKDKNVVKPSDGAAVAAAKLLETYAYCKHQQAAIVPIWATALDAGVLPAAMRAEMMPNCDEELGPKKGVHKINPFDIFMGSEKRISVRGLRMRPDMPRPLYEEDGEKWVNIYAPPIHDAEGGSSDMGIAFIDHLLPDEAERRWYLQWLAHKFRFPGVPGPAVIMVARQFGTGRGTLGVLMSKLFGQRYVVTMPFSMVAGRSYQSQYTDWGASALMAIVNESSDAQGGSVFSAKRDTYEHLKELVEPRAVEKRFVSKGAHFTALSFTTYQIFTNHADALPIPPEDRRFAVLSNGDRGTPEFWTALNEWMDVPANVAAFGAWLEAIDLTGYSPYLAPLMTEAKAAMADESKSDLDRALEIAVDAMPSDVMIMEQIEAGMRQAANTYGFDFPDRWKPIAQRMARARLYRVGVRHGANWSPQIDGKRYAAYAKTDAAARAYTRGDAEELRRAILRNGAPAASGLPGNIVNLVLNREKKDV